MVLAMVDKTRHNLLLEQATSLWADSGTGPDPDLFGPNSVKGLDPDLFGPNPEEGPDPELCEPNPEKGPDLDLLGPNPENRIGPDPSTYMLKLKTFIKVETRKSVLFMC